MLDRRTGLGEHLGALHDRTGAELAALIALGILLGQGYFLGRPASTPATGPERVIRTWCSVGPGTRCLDHTRRKKRQLPRAVEIAVAPGDLVEVPPSALALEFQN